MAKVSSAEATSSQAKRHRRQFLMQHYLLDDRIHNHHCPSSTKPISSHDAGQRARPKIRSAIEEVLPSSDSTGASGPRLLSQSTRDILFGSIAGSLAKLFEHPFDLVKVRLQTQVVPDIPASTSSSSGAATVAASWTEASSSNGMRYSGALDCFTQTVRNEGVKGLYRGLSMPIIGAIAENATLFFTYNAIQRGLLHFSPPPSSQSSERVEANPSNMSISQLAIAAAGAGAVTSLVLTPVELVKCRMQVQMIAQESRLLQLDATAASIAAPPLSAAAKRIRLDAKALQLEGPLQIIASTLRTDGLRGLWLGQTGTLLRETGGGMAWFLSFEIVSRWMLDRLASASVSGTAASSSLSAADLRSDEWLAVRSKLSKKDLSSAQLVVAGAIAGVSYNVILFPADSVKSTIQTEKEMIGMSSAKSSTSAQTATKPSGFLQTFNKIYRTKGIRGLYAGCGITCLRSAPSSALIFLIYNRLEQLAEERNI